MTDSGAPAVWPGGTQNERTTMAWSRTALAVFGCGVLVARQTGSGWAGLALVVVTAYVTGRMIYGSERRYDTRSQALLSGDPIVAVRHLLLAASVTTVFAGAALLTILF